MSKIFSSSKSLFMCHLGTDMMFKIKSEHFCSRTNKTSFKRRPRFSTAENHLIGQTEIWRLQARMISPIRRYGCKATLRHCRPGKCPRQLPAEISGVGACASWERYAALEADHRRSSFANDECLSKLSLEVRGEKTPA
jgi:hypothetical protein